MNPFDCVLVANGMGNIATGVYFFLFGFLPAFAFSVAALIVAVVSRRRNSAHSTSRALGFFACLAAVGLTVAAFILSTGYTHFRYELVGLSLVVAIPAVTSLLVSLSYTQKDD